MRAEIKRAVGRVRGAVRRRGTAIVSRVQTPAAPVGHGWVSSSGAPVLARLDDELMLPRQRQQFRRILTKALASEGVSHWWSPDVGDDDPALCVPESARAAFLSLLARLAGPAWYLDLLDSQGVRSWRYRFARVQSRAVRSAPGLLIWEFVAARTDSGFLARESEGVRVLFWREDLGGELVAQVVNLTATRLPTDQVPKSGQIPRALRPRPIGAVHFPIDVVYTWVDGDDEQWLQAKAAAAQMADPDKFTERAHDEARFADHDELRFSLRSLEQFAPWVNHVWIVTADQKPAWLDPQCDWISVVSHRDIWPDQSDLPTFNSHAIEACLHRISGLAEHFLYLNDDMMLGRPVPPELFFHANGIGKLFPSRALVELGKPKPGEIASTTAAKNARRLLIERYGVTFTRKFLHTAAALTVSGLQELESLFPSAFERTRRARFRTLDDVAAAGSFYLNWAYLVGRTVPGSLRYTYIDPATPDARSRMRTASRARPFDSLCINDGTTQETLEQRKRTDRLIREFFQEYLPVPGTFER